MRRVRASAILVSVFVLAGQASASLVAHYQFEGNANDSSGNGLHGVFVGGATTVADPQRGKVLSLDGAGDYVECADNRKFTISSSLTLACWIKVRMFNKEWQAILTKGDNAWRLQRDGAGQGIEFACTGVSVPGTVHGNVLGSINVNDGQWHHLAGVYDGATVSLYVDGALDRSATATGTISPNAWRVLIGANAQYPGREWSGWIDEVRIYSHALTPAEIAALAGVDVGRSSPGSGGLSQIALAFINERGKVMSGTPNVRCTFDSMALRYEITIEGETYAEDQYVTVVSLSGSNAKAITDSLDGKLLVSMYNSSGDPTTSAFQFITYTPNAAAQAPPVPSQPTITRVVRANGEWGNQPPIGQYDGNTAVLPTQAGGLKDGNLCFSDRTYPWANTPAGLVGAEYVRVFNSDKKSSTVMYTVTTSRPATVLITVDDRIFDQQGAADLAARKFAPARTFVDTGLDLFIREDATTDRPVSVFSARLPAGTYVFGPVPSGHNLYTIGAMD